MKYLVVFSLIAAVASAGYLKPYELTGELQEIAEIVAAINSPSTDPATAAALEQLLLATLGIAQPAPAVVDQAPISVGPALVDFPVPDGGLVTAVQPEAPALVPAPVEAASPAAAAAAPLVQIILNINQASSDAAPIAPVAPAPVETPVIDVQPVQVVDEAVNADSIVPTPVLVVDTAPEPVQIVDVPVVEVEPIQIGTPVIPEPVVVVDTVPEPVQVVDVPVVVPAPVVTLPDVLN